MSDQDRVTTGANRQEMIDNLRELVNAIDKRSWHFDHDREAEIARDAAALRQKALERIAELETEDD